MIVGTCALPVDSILRRYSDGAYTDCYTTVIPRSVSHGDFVTAFYTTWLFKLERLILRWAVAKSSTDRQAHELATGQRKDFATWTVEDRSDDQLLMCDVYGRTRSWLMVAHESTGGNAVTRLYFGSAVVPTKQPTSNRPIMGFQFKALLGFHRLYSRLLLRAAMRRLMVGRRVQ